MRRNLFFEYDITRKHWIWGWVVAIWSFYIQWEIIGNWLFVVWSNAAFYCGSFLVKVLICPMMELRFKINSFSCWIGGFGCKDILRQMVSTCNCFLFCFFYLWDILFHFLQNVNCLLLRKSFKTRRNIAIVLFLFCFFSSFPFCLVSFIYHGLWTMNKKGDFNLNCKPTLFAECWFALYLIRSC